ncbi:hypothetical protein ABXN37_02030 [Piscinibacter sakaiensis]|uniref:hypothetical protein n=1 Tax=Piscinibacter sakaiensis TaxID=1547922 RepID=UPI0012F97F63|nr:hypothetical protein [Piscinibacter sakaiensis]
MAYYLLAIPLLSVAGYVYYLLGTCSSWNCSWSALALASAALIQGNIVFECVYKAEERFDEVVLIRMLTTVVGAACRIGIALSGQGVYWLSLAFVAEGIVAAVLHAIAVKRGYWSYEPAPLKIPVRKALADGLSAVRNSLANLFAIFTVAIHQRLAIILQASVSDPKSVALLNASITILSYLSMPISLYMNAKQGVMLKIKASPNRKGGDFRYWYLLAKLAKAASGYAWLLVVVCLLCSSWLISLVLGERYRGAGLYLAILSPALYAISLGSVRSIHINAIAASDVHLKSAAIGIAALLTSFLLLTPFAEWFGNIVPYTLSISLIFSGLLSSYFIKRMTLFGRVQNVALRSAISWRFIKRASLHAFK